MGRRTVPAVSFQVAATCYDRFMGRFSEPLAGLLADWVGVQRGQRALDVGCGPGALAAVLADRLGADRVAAVDPSEPFVAAARERLPGADVRRGPGEQLPWSDGTFDVTLANLVVHFMTDPVAGLAEMGRVTRAGGTVAATVWDHAGQSGPLSLFWRAVHDTDPQAQGESDLAGTRQGHLGELSTAAGLRGVEESALTVTLPVESFEQWWEPFTLGVGPAGAYVARLDDERRTTLRKRCRELLPSAPFSVDAVAWAVRARPPPIG